MLPGIRWNKAELRYMAAHREVEVHPEHPHLTMRLLM